MKKLLTLLFATLMAGAMTMPIFAATPQMGHSTTYPGQTQTTHKKKKKKKKNKGTMTPGQSGQTSQGGAGHSGSTNPPPAR